MEEWQRWESEISVLSHHNVKFQKLLVATESFVYKGVYKGKIMYRYMNVSKGATWCILATPPTPQWDHKSAWCNIAGTAILASTLHFFFSFIINHFLSNRKKEKKKTTRPRQFRVSLRWPCSTVTEATQVSHWEYHIACRFAKAVAYAWVCI